MKRAFCVLLLFVLLSLTFCGCSPTIANIDDLMRPPKLSGENSGIQVAFELATAGKTIQMKTPTTGSHRSSYVLYDIDGDGEEEVITFYSDATDETAVYMHVLNFSDGRWQSVADVKGKGTEVYKIDFCDMNADGISEIVVCWSLFESRGGKILTVYAPSFEEESQTVRELVSEPFTQSVILDIDGDGTDEIFLAEISVSNDKTSTLGKVLSMDSDLGIYSMGIVELTPAVSILALQSQPATKDSPAFVFLDSVINETTAITDIIYWDKETFSLKAPLSETNRSAFSETARSASLTSADIDKDGQLEIPVTKTLDGAQTVSGEEVQPLELTTWLKFSNGALSAEQRDLMIYSSSYMFSFSETDAKNIAVVNDTAERICSFYKRNHAGERGSLLFEIVTVPSVEWERRQMEDYTVLTTNHSLTYAYKITEQGTLEDIDDVFIASRFSTLTA